MRRGNATVIPGITLPTGPLQRADLQQLGEPVVQIDLLGVGDEEIADLSFGKLITGTIVGTEAENVYSDGVSTGTTAFNSATAAFTSGDNDAPISGATIPVGTTIVSRTSSTQVELSNAVPAGTGITFMLDDRDPGAGTKDLILNGGTVRFFSGNYRPATTDTPGRGWGFAGNGQYRLYSGGDGVFAGRLENLTLTVVWRTASYTVLRTDFHILCNAVTAAIDVQIPLSNLSRGRILIVTKNDASGNDVNVLRTGADTIEGATSVALAAQWDKVMLQADGLSTWLKI